MNDLAGTRQQVAERLGVELQKIDELVREGRIPHVRLGPRVIRFPWQAIEQWLAQGAAASLTQTEEQAAG